MINPENNIKIPLTPENNFIPRNENFLLNYEKNPNYEYSQMENGRINKDLNDSEENIFISHENSLNGPDSIYFDNDIINKEENCDLEKDCFINNRSAERVIDSNALQKHQNLEIIHFRTTTYQYDTINGKKIITKNDLINNKFSEKFPTIEFNIEDIKEMQFIRIKNGRRTKDEIEKTKQSLNSEPKKKKKIGRQKKDFKEVYPNEEKIHGKDNDDNIIKKLNSTYLESIRIWLNKSFIDEELNFLNEKENVKKKQYYFVKLDPKIINNQIKKEVRIEILNKKFRNIFHSYSISSLYKKFSKSSNKDLIEKIYNENNQPFVMYILELTYLEGLNYFNGQITDQGIIEYFKKKYNYDEDIILKFINHFEKFDKFFDELFEKNKEKDKNELFKYMAKISILSLNYKESFECKHERKENNKNDDSDSD